MNEAMDRCKGTIFGQVVGDALGLGTEFMSKSLCRYVARPAVATDRLSLLPDGRVMYKLKHRRQQDAIEYLHTENRVLREKLGKNRILLNDDQRRRLAGLR